MPRDAEAWLAERGIEREPIRVPLAPPAPPDASDATDAPAEPTGSPSDGASAPDAASVRAPDTAKDAPPVGAREASRLAGQAAADADLAADEARVHPPTQEPRLEDDVAEAMAFVRRSTAATPQSEGRVRTKLAERGWPPAVVDLALERARRERLVDDPAMAAALVDERRAKGHAPARIRRDLRERGFGDDVLDAALGAAESEDPQAAAFAVAQDKAATLTGVPTETAFRRVAAFVARRGYPQGLARKVARDAVFASRDPERTAGH